MFFIWLVKRENCKNKHVLVWKALEHVFPISPVSWKKNLSYKKKNDKRLLYTWLSNKCMEQQVLLMKLLSLVSVTWKLYPPSSLCLPHISSWYLQGIPPNYACIYWCLLFEICFFAVTVYLGCLPFVPKVCHQCFEGVLKMGVSFCGWGYK